MPTSHHPTVSQLAGTTGTHWPAMRLAEVLRLRKEFITIDDLTTYKRSRVQLHAIRGEL